jgi:hypothetical protein
MLVTLLIILLGTFAALAVLKLVGVISASWLTLLAVLWIPGSVFAAIGVIFGIFYLLYWAGRILGGEKRKRREYEERRKAKKRREAASTGFRLQTPGEGKGAPKRTAPSKPEGGRSSGSGRSSDNSGGGESER